MTEAQQISKSSSLADFFYIMGDVAAGKISLKEACKELNEKDKEKAQRFFEVAKATFEIIKKSIKEQEYDNNIQAKYDLSSAVKVEIDGKPNYIGAKPKEKLPWLKQFVRNTGRGMKRRGELLSGEKTAKQVIREELNDVHKSFLESKAYRKVHAVVKGTLNARKHIKDLQGLAPTTTSSSPQTENPYDKLTGEQFDVAMQTAYTNIIRMQHFGVAMPDTEKQKAIAEINLLMESAQKRFPETQPTSKGSYFTDPALQETEAKLFAFVQQSDPKSSNDDLKKYSAWREGKDFTMPLGGKMLAESPFNNIELYGKPLGSEYAGPLTAQDHLYNPLKSGKNTMTKEDVALAKERLAKLTIR